MRGSSEPSQVFGVMKVAERLLSLQGTLMASDVQGPALANLSPQVVASVLWFFCRFSKSYLMPPETGYDTIVYVHRLSTKPLASGPPCFKCRD
jgi:hypothetical protein